MEQIAICMFYGVLLYDCVILLQIVVSSEVIMPFLGIGKKFKIVVFLYRLHVLSHVVLLL